MRQIWRAVLCAAVGAGICVAQAPDNTPAAALEHGPLVVWMVTPGTAVDKALIIMKKQSAYQGAPTTSEERTLAEFGTPSSQVGQTAGSYGQTAGSFGQSSSNVGQTAGSYGTTAGSFGQTASSHGTNAGSYGQTAGSFGQTSSTYGQTLGGTSLAPAGAKPAPVWNPVRDELAADAHATFPGLQVRYVDVITEELQDRLAAAGGSVEYPDVIIAATLPDWWDGSGLGLATLGGPNVLEVSDQPHGGPSWRGVKTSILVKAPHPAAARAFVLWMREQAGCGLCRVPTLDKSLSDPTRIAVSALGDVLQGAGLGSQADVSAVKFDAEEAQNLALGSPPQEVLDGLKYRIDVMDAAANDQLAVVSLRAIVWSPLAFGAVHALVVLRSDGKHWKVLQVSPNLRIRAWENGFDQLKAFALPGTPARVTGVSLAAPIDGDNRPPAPDLWWDNGSGAGLLVVEWQMNLEDWTDSRLMFVPDSNPRVQTRVPASFARMPGEYRWRVWSVGKGGALTLSPWRSLNIVQ